MVQPENNKKKQQQTAVFVKDPAAFPCVPLLFSAQDPASLGMPEKLRTCEILLQHGKSFTVVCFY